MKMVTHQEETKQIVLPHSALVESHKRLKRAHITLIVSIVALEGQNVDYDREIAHQLRQYAIVPLEQEMANLAKLAGLVNEMGGDGEE